MNRSRRKRTNKNVPAKGRLRDIADQLWSLSVRYDWNWKCAVCGDARCEAHHLIPRSNQATRYDLNNGIALCAQHHQFCPKISPHQNAAGWLQWLAETYPMRHKWYTETVSCGDHLRFSGTTNHVYYSGVILSFRQYIEPAQFEDVVGVRFAAWLGASMKGNT